MTDQSQNLAEHIADTRASREVMLVNVNNLKDSISSLAMASLQVNTTLATLPSKMAKELTEVLKEQAAENDRRIQRYEDEHQRLFFNLQQTLINHDDKVERFQTAMESAVTSKIGDVKEVFVNAKSFRAELITFVKEFAAILAALIAMFGIYRALSGNVVTRTVAPTAVEAPNIK